MRTSDITRPKLPRRAYEQTMYEPIPVDSTNISQFTSVSAGPTILEFWAPWCAPCLALAPAMRELVYEMEGVARVARMDIEANPEIASSMGIYEAPTVVILIKGKVAAHVVGFQPSSRLKLWVRRVLNTDGIL